MFGIHSNKNGDPVVQLPAATPNCKCRSCAVVGVKQLLAIHLLLRPGKDPKTWLDPILMAARSRCQQLEQQTWMCVRVVSFTSSSNLIGGYTSSQTILWGSYLWLPIGSNSRFNCSKLIFLHALNLLEN